MTEKLGKKFEAKELSDRTVKERLRTSSGPRMKPTMDNIKDTKAAKKKKTVAKKKVDLLQSQKEILREKATKRRCQRKSSEGSGTGLSGASEGLADTASTGAPSDTEGNVGDVSAYMRKSSLKLAASASTGLAEYLGFQRQLRNEEMARQECMEYAYKKERNWTEELEMRREEAAIRRSELEVCREELNLFHQLLLKQYDHQQS
ncbi:hypothetical protein DVH05_006132 [Phytophthora capsici]|nr:hypothetical protein DVH05_006132 [Phytophthora capsici]